MVGLANGPIRANALMQMGTSQSSNQGAAGHMGKNSK